MFQVTQIVRFVTTGAWALALDAYHRHRDVLRLDCSSYLADGHLARDCDPGPIFRVTPPGIQTALAVSTKLLTESPSPSRGS